VRLLLVRSGNIFKPAFKSDASEMAKLKEDEPVLFTAKRHRNLMHHRKFFAVLKMVCDNCERWESPEQLLIALKVKLGYVNMITGLDGESIVAPGSIRFEVMDQDSFSRLYDAALPICAEQIGVTVADIEKNYLEYM
jgi:hypothetical protein